MPLETIELPKLYFLQASNENHHIKHSTQASLLSTGVNQHQSLNKLLNPKHLLNQNQLLNLNQNQPQNPKRLLNQKQLLSLTNI